MRCHPGAFWGAFKDPFDAINRFNKTHIVLLTVFHCFWLGEQSVQSLKHILVIEGNNGFAGDIVPSAAKAWKAISKGNWDIAKREFESILLDFERFGGSRAQRDLLEFAYVNVLLRTGKREAASKILLDRRPAFYQTSAIMGLTD